MAGRQGLHLKELLKNRSPAEKRRISVMGAYASVLSPYRHKFTDEDRAKGKVTQRIKRAERKANDHSTKRV